MSQLNDDKIIDKDEINEKISKENKKKVKQKSKTKMKSKTKLIIFLVVFMVLCIGITVGAILYKKKTKKDIYTLIKNEYNVQKTIDDGLGIGNLLEKYDENDLKISSISKTKTEKLSVSYVQIDGMKNITIQNQINQEIKDFIESLEKEELNYENIDEIRIDVCIIGNFANVLSMEVNKHGYSSNEYISDINESYGLNYDLTTGNKIEFKDLFTNQASVKNILTQNIYDNILIDNINFSEDIENIDATKSDLSNVEDEVYKTLNICLKKIEDNKSFSFSAKEITIYLNNKYITIDAAKSYQYIAIYNRFKTDNSIFNGNYQGKKNIFVFYQMHNWGEEIKEYYFVEDVYDNLRIEIYMNFTKAVVENEQGKIAYNNYIKDLESKVEKLKTEAKNNPDKAIVYTYKGFIDGHKDEKIKTNNFLIGENISSQKYTMTKQYYKDYFYSKIAKFYRDVIQVSLDPIVFDYYENDSNVTISDKTTAYKTYDVFTNKTEDQLNGDMELEVINSDIQNNMEDIKNAIYYNNLIYNYEYRLESVKEQYNLTDEDVKDTKELIEKLRIKIEEYRKQEETIKQNMQNENGTNQIVENNTVNQNTNNELQENTILVNNTVSET